MSLSAVVWGRGGGGEGVSEPHYGIALATSSSSSLFRDLAPCLPLYGFRIKPTRNPNKNRPQW